jgi:hypothetical protein
MSLLDGDRHAQTKAGGVETSIEKEWYRGYTGSPPTCLDFPDFPHRCSTCLPINAAHMAPDANAVTATPTTTVSDHSSELEDALHYPSFSFTEPVSFSRDGHDANDLADMKTCFLEESLLFDYNPTLDTSSVYTTIPPDDRSTSNAGIKLQAINAAIGRWPFEIATPTVVGESLSNTMAQDKHGLQSKQADSDSDLTTLSAAFWVTKRPAEAIKDPMPDLVKSAALDRSGKGPVLVVQSTIVLPPIAMAAVPTKEQGSLKRKRNPTDKKCIPEQKPYRDTDILMGRGGNATYHPGNKRYLVAMKKRLVQYHNSVRSDKIKISQQVVDEVHAWGGRFLKRVKESSEYVEVSNKIARTRVSQALRDGKPFE